jgi:serine/threonine-protein kinase
MVNRLSPCDPDRLRSFLDEALSEGEQARLADHLDHCGQCQRTLERLAAGSGFWNALPDLGDLPELETSSFDRDGKAARPRGARRSKAGREGLGFLAPSDLPGAIGRLGPYEVLDVLGEGGMGIVVKAFDPALHRVVAIKVLAPQMAASGAARRRFDREARAAAAVVHDHVVAIHAVDTEPEHGLPYLVMPYIAGPSLQQRIDRDGPLPIKEVLRIGMQTALGLAAAHAQGLVHRDIKPSNILLENGVERVKITDFGLARAVDDASQSQSGFVAGTPQYMSPEQAQGESVDHRADLFSLGSVLYAMCAGHSPFRAKTTMGVLRRVSDDAPRPLYEINPEVSAELEAVIGRLHAKDPSQRYQQASEVADELGRQLAELQRSGARPPRRRLSAEPAALVKPLKAPDDELRTDRRSRSRKLVPLAMALLVVGLGTVVFSARQGPLSPPPSGLLPMVIASADELGEGGTPARVTIVNEGAQARTIVGSGKPATKAWTLADFKAIEVIHPFRVEVAKGNAFEVSTTADDNVLEHVVAEKDGSKLRIRLVDNWTYHLKRNSLKARITMPSIESIALSHGAQATLAGGFETKGAFEAHTRHGSRLEGSMIAGRLVIDSAHGSTVALKGNANSARIVAAHGSQLPLEGLALHDAEVVLEHGSRARINAEPGKAFNAGVWHGCTLLGSVRGGNLKLKAEHGSRIALKGSGRSASIEGSHSARFSLAELALDEADVRLEFGSSAAVQARDKLGYELSHSATLRYVGNPSITRSHASQGSSARAARPEDLKVEAVNETGWVPGQPAAGAAEDDRAMVITLRNGHYGSWDGPAIEGSGRRASKTIDVKDFSKLVIERAVTAEVTRAEGFSVKLEADDNLLDRIEAVRDGATLRIRMAEGSYRMKERPKARITLPALGAIRVAGASNATIRGFESDRPFAAEASGASTLEGSVKAGVLEANASGASTVALEGSSHGARLLASGASKLKLGEFEVRSGTVTIEGTGASVVELRGSAQAGVLRAQGSSRLGLKDLALEAADVELAAASHATCRVERLLDYDVSSASHLEYSGDPKIGKAKRTRESAVVRQ